MADTQQPPAANAPQAQTQGQNSTSVEGQAPAAQADTNDFSSKFAQLARKTKTLREEQRKLQADRDAWKSKETEYSSAISLVDRIKRDPVSVLAEQGITPDQLTSLLVNQANPQEANQLFSLQQENKDLRAQIEKINKRFEDNDSAAYTGAINQIKNDTKVLVDSDKSHFEMIDAAGDDGIEAVAELCRIVWEEDHVLMSVQEAAELVEQDFLERSIKLASANKVKAKLSPAPTEPTQTPTIPGKTQQTKTLNSQAAQASSSPLSARERAIKAFRGEL